MNHCIIMTAYQDVEMINRFISAIPKEWGIYIHLDRKSKISEAQIDNRAHVYSIARIYWGSWEHLHVIHYMLGEAVKDDRRFDYFHIVSGQDYFSSKPGDFDKLVGINGVNYIGCFSIPNSNWGWDGGTKIYQYRTLSTWCDIRMSWPRLLNKVLYILQKYTFTRRRLPKIPLYGGAVYSSLHRDYVDWITSNTEAIVFLNKLKHTTCAEEIYFQTMIMNSPYRDFISNDDPLRYVDWKCDPAPKFLNETDFDCIISSNTLFCRKVASSKSATLLRQLDNHFSLQND